MLDGRKSTYDSSESDSNATKRVFGYLLGDVWRVRTADLIFGKESTCSSFHALAFHREHLRQCEILKSATCSFEVTVTAKLSGPRSVARSDIR